MNVKIMGLSEPAFRRVSSWCGKRCFKTYECNDNTYDCTLADGAILKTHIDSIRIDLAGNLETIKDSEFVKVEII